MKSLLKTLITLFVLIVGLRGVDANPHDMISWILVIGAVAFMLVMAQNNDIDE